MKSSLFISLLFVSGGIYAEAVIPAHCEVVTVPLQKLQAGQMVRVDQGEMYASIYMRTPEEVAYSLNRDINEFDNKYPSWWPSDKYPIQQIGNPERSLTPKYFVFWSGSPMYSHHVSLIKQREDWHVESYDLSYLPNPIVPGFIDYHNQIYFDVTGRPVRWGEKSMGHNYSKLPLLIPSYVYNSNENSITITCTKN
ncbi:hypothetical protein ACFKA9_005587 [Vibrio parahaemolyticus]